MIPGLLGRSGFLLGGRLKTAPALLWLAAWGATGVLLVSSFRGLEGTDEAAWVLCAANPWQSPGWGIFFGFLLHPLFLAGFSQLAGFRIAGILVLLLLTLFFARSLQRAWPVMGLKDVQGVSFCGLPALLIGALAYYSDGTRTPGYNWLLLAGGMLFAAGWFRLEMATRPAQELMAVALAAAGLVVAAIGKWTSLAAYLLLLGWLIADAWQGKQGVRRAALFLGAVFFWTGLFCLYATPKGIEDTLSAGWVQAATGSHSQLLPKYVVGLLKGSWQVLRAFPYVAVLYLLIWAGYFLVRRKKPDWATVAAATFLTGVALTYLRGHWLGGATNFSKGMMVTLVWLSGVACLLVPLSIGKNSPTPPLAGPARRALVLLLLLPWANGLGTATGITDYLAYGVVFFVAAGLVLLGLGCRRGLPAGCAVAALVTIGLIHAPRAASSTWNTYRLGSVWQKMILVEAGPEKGKFYHFPSTVEALRFLEGDLIRAGFRRGNPIVGITDLPGPIYFLGGVSPGACWYMGMFLSENAGVRKHLSGIPPEILVNTWVFVRAGTRSNEQVEAVWPHDKGVPMPVLLEKEYLWPWGDGAGVLQPLKVYRPAALAAP